MAVDLPISFPCLRTVCQSLHSGLLVGLHSGIVQYTGWALSHSASLQERPLHLLLQSFLGRSPSADGEDDKVELLPVFSVPVLLAGPVRSSAVALAGPLSWMVVAGTCVLGASPMEAVTMVARWTSSSGFQN